MTLIGHTMMCEQAAPKPLAQKVGTMQLLSDCRFTLGLGLGAGRISMNTLSAANGRT
jgi:alkanesulfonate monooxygenase SsuD/methylene tetrahydromethanopterin reductase-like flavin-dependent oxidoreductase (luciferase family)